MPPTLPGGFVFENGSTAGFIDGSKEQPYDDSKKVIGAIYRKADKTDKMAYLTLSVSNTPVSPDEMKFYKEIASNNSKKLYYRSYIVRNVAPSYKLTAQDKEDELSGKVMFVYDSTRSGDAIPERSHSVQSVLWEDDGVYYALSDNGNNLDQEKLTQISEAVINY